MCGIFATLSDTPQQDILDVIDKLDYRGYDGYGALLADKYINVNIHKELNKQRFLRYIKQSSFCSKNATVGVLHTRWAVFGAKEYKNIHPHCNNNKTIYIVHNGIIDNVDYLKGFLSSENKRFYSDTDTEILAKYLSYFDRRTWIDILDHNVEGDNSVIIWSRDYPNEIFIHTKGTKPFFISKDGKYVASDINCLSGLCDKAVILRNSGAILTKTEGLKETWGFLKDIDVKNDKGDSDLGKWPHYMIKEIYEQPDLLRNTALKHGVGGYLEEIKFCDTLTFVGCGSSYYAGLYGKQIFERQHLTNVRCEYASEFITGDNRDWNILISQSGETKDVLDVAEKIKDWGTQSYLAITNYTHSPLGLDTTDIIEIQSGVEIGVAATKTFLLTCVRLFELANYGSNFNNYKLFELTNAIDQLLENTQEIQTLAKQYKDEQHILLFGKGYDWPIALEGALKIAEVANIHASAQSSGETKHGMLSLIDENMPCVFIVNQINPQIISNIAEVQARKGRVFIITNEESSHQLSKYTDNLFITPNVSTESLQPLLSLVVLQLISYYIAVEKGLNPDRPVSLAKAISV